MLRNPENTLFQDCYVKRAWTQHTVFREDRVETEESGDDDVVESRIW